ncbi:DUF503 domain-containing protein [Aeromicrobium sp. CTD01-1L150]|uniref:DUF503 domain-containing protein n=1 Tax=Aeromicrobium sp. CTD01-1L150 TaxID=3341830 RepID=UPI0035C0C203
MWIGWLELDLRLGDVHSLKAKRSLVRPIVADLRRTLQVAAAETSSLDLHRRAGVGVSLVAADRAHVVEVLARAEQVVLSHPEVEVLASRTRVLQSEDV